MEPLDKSLLDIQFDERESLEALKIVQGISLKGNYVTEQEFMRFSPLYSDEECKRLSDYERFELVNAFEKRFSMFHPITITNSLGEIKEQLPPAIISPKTWNDLNVPIMAEYRATLELSDPIRRFDKGIVEDIKQLILSNTDNEVANKYRAMYHTREEKRKSSTNSNTETDLDNDSTERLKIDSSEWF